MAHRLFRTVVFVMLTIALLAPSPSRAEDPSELRPTIAFVSTRDHLELTGPGQFAAGEIYLMNPTADLTQQDLRRLTDNTWGDGFANLSPDGTRIVFDSNRRRIDPEPVNTSDLFLMNTRGTGQRFLTRGSNASWAPDGKHIAFHASASGHGLPLRADPGSVTEDSDIFVINVDDCLEDVDACQNPEGPIKQNLTNTNTDAGCEDDAEWSADGLKIVFTSHPCTEYVKKSFSAEIYVMNPDGTGREPLTHNTQEDAQKGVEERAPAWSPEGDRIVFMCKPDPDNQTLRFELCVMDDAGNNWTQLTSDAVFQASPQWLTNTEITFDVTNNLNPQDPKRKQLWKMNLDDKSLEQLTDTLGTNAFASPGVVRIPGKGQGPVAVGSTDRSADTVRGPAVNDGKADHGKQDKDKPDNKHKKGKKHKGSGKRHR